MRRLVVCCDGTWCTPDQEQQGVPTPTNVVRIYNAVSDQHKDRSEQIKYYHPGVGTEGPLWQRITGGSSGVGLGKNIMSAYKWLGVNYQPGDKIFLFGFSRGAYTVRSLAGMIAACGLLDLSDLLVKNAWGRVTKAFEKCYRVSPDKRNPKWSKNWEFHSGNTDGAVVPIHFMGVWDTVGALGIPDNLALLNMFDPDRKHSFHDTKLSKLVLHAYHAVAIDEWRASFTPTLWTDVENRSNVHQVWFPGSHSDVGGGYLEKGLSDGALQWMVNAAKNVGNGLTFQKDMRTQIRPNHQDVLHDSHNGFFSILPTHPRPIPLLLKNINETKVDQSVFDRHEHPPINQASYHPTRVLDAGESIERAIYAMEPWNDTGIYLEKGKNYEFIADGEWLDRTIPCGPAGTSDGIFHVAEVAHIAGSLWGKIEETFKWLTGNESADFKATKRVEEIPWFCLVGAIANSGNPAEDGTPIPSEIFRIGKERKYTPLESGYLYCFANDAWNFYDNNRGSVSLITKCL